MTSSKKRTVGRPPGKTSDPSYIRVSLWMQRSLHADLKTLADRETDPKDLGDVIDSLLDLDIVKARLEAVGFVRK